MEKIIVKANKISEVKYYNGKTRAADTVYTVNGIIVATHRKYAEMFCSIKHGVRSNLRDTCKMAGSFSWDVKGLEDVTGKHVGFISSRCGGSKFFRNVYPDTNWGSTGMLSCSAKYVREQIEAFVNAPDEITDAK